MSGDGLPPDEGRRRFVTWLWRLPVLAALGGGAWAGWRWYSVYNMRQPANPAPEFEAHPPVEVAPLAELSEPWAAREFFFASLPVIALNVPEPLTGGVSAAGHNLIAYSRICTHQGCPVELSRDTEAVAFAYNYRSTSPSLVCPCHLSVFAPDRHGEAVSGPAMRALPRIRLEVSEDRVVATGVEKI